jgi:exodeoxyribonuclease VII large subunit
MDDGNMSAGTAIPIGKQPAPWTVGQLIAAVRSQLQASFSDLWVVGETSGVTTPSSGHIYFSLKGDKCLLKAAMFRPDAMRIRFPVADGLRVLCRGSVDIYAPRGDCQFIVRHMEPMGEGQHQQAFRQLHERLSREGLFDARHKKAIPLFPQFVLLVTSPAGAAIHDFLEIAKRRWTQTRIAILPTNVQNAASQIAQTLKKANLLSPQPDVIVLARGGGSIEDLWSFNEEEVVRAIFASQIPVVSAIGHEIDVTLSDLVADVRALTPSEAAERVFPDREEWKLRLRQTSRHLLSLIGGQVQSLRSRLLGLQQRPALARPRDQLHDQIRRLDELEVRSKNAIRRTMRDSFERLAQTTARLESLSPLKVLSRGYSVTQMAGTDRVVLAADQLRKGDRLRHRFAEGVAISTVDEIQGT